MPSSTISFLPILNTIPVTTMLWWVFVLMSTVFCIHALVVTYHWFTYGTERSIPLIGSILYIGFGVLLLIAMAITLTTL